MLSDLFRQHITLCERLIQSDKETLYVCRPLLNSETIRRWAADQGFESALSDNDLHVTVAYSKTPIAWQQFVPQHKRLSIRGGARTIQKLGDKGAIVLSFASNLLLQRWSEFRDGGASWDYENYHPHVTISYKSDVNIESIQPYQGDLVFGPEKFDTIQDDWDKRSVNEKPLATSNELG